MSTLRAGFSEHTASTRPAARWQSVRASDPITRVRGANPTMSPICSATESVLVASNGQDLHVLLRPGAVERRAVEERSSPRRAVHSSRVPKSKT